MIASSRSEAHGEASGHRSGGRPVSVLHLVGSTQDDGGILTVLRHARDPDGLFRHAVVVHRGFHAKRQPPLDVRESRWLLAESPRHLSLFARALGVVMETRRRCRVEHWDIVHAHSRGGFAAAVLLALILLVRGVGGHLAAGEAGGVVIAAALAGVRGGGGRRWWVEAVGGDGGGYD